MPVIINQLSVVIKTATGQDNEDDKRPRGNEVKKISEVIGKEEIIREAVEQILQILRSKQER